MNYRAVFADSFAKLRVLRGLPPLAPHWEPARGTVIPNEGSSERNVVRAVEKSAPVVIDKSVRPIQSRKAGSNR